MKASDQFITSFGVFMIFIWHYAWAEFYTSIAHMTDLHEIEDLLIQNLNNYVESQELKIETIRKFLRNYEENNVQSKNVTEFVSNPINSFKIIKRLTSDWDYLHKTIIDDYTDDYFENLENYHSDLDFPTFEDLDGVMNALTRLQETYNLKASDIASGVLKETKYNTRLTAMDCLDIGVSLYFNKNFQLASEWLKQAENKFSISNDKLEELLLTWKYWALAEYNLGNYDLAIRISAEIIKNEPNNWEWINHRNKFQQQLNSKYLLLKKNPSKPKDILHYEALCRNEITRSPKATASLTCQYLNGKAPFLKIAPIKMEEISHDPKMLLFHDVIYDTEISWIMGKTTHRLKRSGFRYRGDTEDSYNDARTGKYAWLKSNNETIKSIDARIEDITGLTVQTAELLQVVNYGVGGHYEAHCDFIQNKEELMESKTGDRIATILFYMTDVAEGGATVFPVNNITVNPIKGSALLWFNLHKSGDPDFRTEHAACPVLVGSKWICNKWLREKGQEFLRPCGLQSDNSSKDKALAV